jgi:hypothetical protein
MTTAEVMPLARGVAYAVGPTDPFDDEMGWEIVFAGSEAEALVLGAAATGGDVESLHARRVEWADRYEAHGRAPASAWIENGWSHGCDGGCDEQLTSDDAPICDDATGEVWCSKSCRRAELRRRARRAKLTAQARDRLLRRMPEALVKYTSECVLSQCNGKHTFAGHARFTFPGAKHEADFCAECRVAFVHPDDLGAWNAATRGPAPRRQRGRTEAT